jgi:HSP20 family protein
MENNKQDAIVRKESGFIIKFPEPERIIVAPLADLIETSDDFVLKLDIPGARKNSIRLTVDSELLTIYATTNSDTDQYAKQLYCEIGLKNYIREFHLGQGINLDNISAQYENGVLTITLPKTEEVKAREIKIN